MTGVGPGSSAMQRLTSRTTHALRPPQAPTAPETPNPAHDPGADTPKPSTAATGTPPTSPPAWLAAANRIREQLAAADHRSDQQRTDASQHDRRALERLAELSQRMTPWKAAVTMFGGNE